MQVVRKSQQTILPSFFQTIQTILETIFQIILQTIFQTKFAL